MRQVPPDCKVSPLIEAAADMMETDAASSPNSQR
jgi:hypothetical protein